MTSVVNKRTTDEWDVDIMRPGPYGNPYVIGKHGTRQQCIELYRQRLYSDVELQRLVQPLRGKRLACCCKPLACHGDVLVEFLDSPPKLLTY